MIEMLGVLAIIGVLSVGGIMGYSVAMKNYKTNKFFDDVGLMVAKLKTIHINDANKNVTYSIPTLREFGVITDEYWNTYEDYSNASWIGKLKTPLGDTMFITVFERNTETVAYDLIFFKGIMMQFQIWTANIKERKKFCAKLLSHNWRAISPDGAAIMAKGMFVYIDKPLSPTEAERNCQMMMSYSDNSIYNIFLSIKGYLRPSS